MAKKDYSNYTKEELIKEVESLKKQKTYGLVWEDGKTKENFDYYINWEGIKNKEDFGIANRKYPVLKEIKTKEIKTNNSNNFNFLIEGDNYHSLSVLNFTHEKKIDLIYIDPPYNTGHNDFRYNDKIVDTEDQYRHSKWLSFMSKRLNLSKKLMKDSGVIFISIDDNELAQLKLICDEIFGEKNFINCICVKSKNIAGASGGGEDKRFKKNIEYLVCYAKKYTKLKLFKPIYKKTELMNYINSLNAEGVSWKYTSVLYDFGSKTFFKTIKDGSGKDIKIYKHADYKTKSITQIAKEQKVSLEEAHYKYFDKLMTTAAAQSSIRTKVWDATGNKDELYSIEYFPRSGKNKDKKTTLYYIGKKKRLITWLSDTAVKENKKMYRLEKFGTFWDGLNWNNVNREGNIGFNNGKKPIDLIKRIITLIDTKDICVLDFFAGSGTTGHAVLELNNEDNQNRSYILCTNNEDNTGEGKIIDKICLPRLKNCILGYSDKKPLGSNLKYFKTDFVDSKGTDKNKRKLVNESTDMICIKESAFEEVINKPEFKIFKNDKIHLGIIFDEDSIPDFIKEAKKINNKFHVYIFSLDASVPEEEFKEIKNKVKLCPIPEVILHVYRRVFKND